MKRCIDVPGDIDLGNNRDHPRARFFDQRLVVLEAVVSAFFSSDRAIRGTLDEFRELWNINTPALVITEVQMQNIQSQLAHRIHDANDCRNTEEMARDINMQAAVPVCRVVKNFHSDGLAVMIGDRQSVKPSQAS